MAKLKIELGLFQKAAETNYTVSSYQAGLIAVQNW